MILNDSMSQVIIRHCNSTQAVAVDKCCRGWPRRDVATSGADKSAVIIQFHCNMSTTLIHDYAYDIFF